MYCIVLSGPTRTQADAEVALDLADVPVMPEDHPHRMAYPPSIASGKKPRAKQAFLTVQHDDINVPADLVAKYGWVLRQHYHVPEQLPEMAAQNPTADHDLRATVADLKREIDLLKRMQKVGALMAVETPPWAIQAGGLTYPAEQTRRAMYALMNRTSGNTPGLISGGVMSQAAFALTPPGSGLSVTVAPGEAIIPGSEGGSQGGYYARGTSATVLAIATANASNPRIDAIYATVSDSNYTEPTGGSGNQWALQVITGTPTAGATLANLLGAGAAPASSLLIGYVLVPTSAASIVTADLSYVARAAQVSAGGTCGWGSQAPPPLCRATGSKRLPGARSRCRRAFPQAAKR